MIENGSGDMKFKIDETNQASLFKVDDIEDIIIPCTVKRNSIEYLITSVCVTSERIKTIKFVDDSEAKTIYRNAFLMSYIEEIDLPAGLKSHQILIYKILIILPV